MATTVSQSLLASKKAHLDLLEQKLSAINHRESNADLSNFKVLVIGKSVKPEVVGVTKSRR